MVAFFDVETEFVDTTTTAKHAIHLAKSGVAGIVTQGSNGEAVHLTREERRLITETVRSALDSAGFDHLPIITGCGTQSVLVTVQYCRDVYEAGADGALVLPPSYYPCSRQSLIDFYHDVANESPIPILIYNYPPVAAGVDLDSDIIIELAQHKNILGCKLTCGNTGKLNRIASAVEAATPGRPGSGWMCLGGLADFTLPAMIAGGSGIITGVGNLAPKTCVRLLNLYQEGRLKEAQELQAVVARGEGAWVSGGITGGKCALEANLGYGGYGRRPLPKANKQQAVQHTARLQEIISFENGLRHESSL